MKNARILELVIWVACAVCFLFFPQNASTGTANGLKTCMTVVLPSLFPFFVLTNYWVNAGYADKIAGFFAPMMEHVFHLPGAASSALVLGSIGGYPIGAKTACQLYKEKRLTKIQAEQVLLFCNNAGPAFIIGVVGTGVFRHVGTGMILYVIHILSAYLIGFAWRPKEKIDRSMNEVRAEALEPVSQRITSAVTDAGSTAILVSTYILFFAIITQCICNLISSKMAVCILTGLMEISGGSSVLSELAVSYSLKFVLAALLLGFGGICILLQSLSVLHGAGLTGSRFLAGKLCHGLLSALLAALIAPLIPTPVPCAMNMNIHHFIPLQQAALILIILMLGLIFLKESSGKVRDNQI